jgi:hypothetical protein
MADECKHPSELSKMPPLAEFLKNIMERGPGNQEQEKEEEQEEEEDENANPTDEIYESYHNHVECMLFLLNSMKEVLGTTTTTNSDETKVGSRTGGRRKKSDSSDDLVAANTKRIAKKISQFITELCEMEVKKEEEANEADEEEEEEEVLNPSRVPRQDLPSLVPDTRVD